MQPINDLLCKHLLIDTSGKYNKNVQYLESVAGECEGKVLRKHSQLFILTSH